MIRTQDVEPMVYSNLKAAAKSLTMYSDLVNDPRVVEMSVQSDNTFYASHGMKFAEVKRLTIRTGA